MFPPAMRGAGEHVDEPMAADAGHGLVVSVVHGGLQAAPSLARGGLLFPSHDSFVINHRRLVKMLKNTLNSCLKTSAIK